MAATADGTREAIVQGRTEPDPDEADRLGPFTRSLNVRELDHWYATANMFYSRATLERLGGFDETTFSRPGGEDTDLAWRAIADGVPTAFSADARVWHAVHELGPLKRLRFATRWDETMAVFGRYPELRRRTLIRGLFWKESHYHLARTIAGLLLPGRLRLIGAYCAWRYALLLWRRAHWHGDGKGGGPLLVPYYLAENVIELATAVRGAVRYRTPVL
jgi:GT2 family glycosyltransferase